jgi:hypothetical protein
LANSIRFQLRFGDVPAAPSSDLDNLRQRDALKPCRAGGVAQVMNAAHPSMREFGLPTEREAARWLIGSCCGWND